jgi:hypothetical protein
MNVDSKTLKGERPDGSKKVYHKSNRIATGMRIAARSDVVDAGMVVRPAHGSGNFSENRSG